MSVLHNLVHQLSGVTGLALTGLVATAAASLLVGETKYAVLREAGLAGEMGSTANVLLLDVADTQASLSRGDEGRRRPPRTPPDG